MKINWFEIWYDERQGMLETMTRNMAADLQAGYDYYGRCIQQQLMDIDAYKKKFDDQLMGFAEMDEAKRNRWCYYDLLRRGAITR